MRRKKRVAAIDRAELVEMHARLKAEMQELSRCGLDAGPGTSEYSLLCALGRCLGNWPRVKRKKAEELRERFAFIVGE